MIYSDYACTSHNACHDALMHAMGGLQAMIKCIPEVQAINRYTRTLDLSLAMLYLAINQYKILILCQECT